MVEPFPSEQTILSMKKGIGFLPLIARISATTISCSMASCACFALMEYFITDLSFVAKENACTSLVFRIQIITQKMSIPTKAIQNPSEVKVPEIIDPIAITSINPSENSIMNKSPRIDKWSSRITYKELSSTCKNIARVFPGSTPSDSLRLPLTNPMNFIMFVLDFIRFPPMS